MTEPKIPYLIKGPSFAEGLAPEEDTAAFRAQIDKPEALELFDYWLTKCRDDGPPMKQDISPMDFPKLLPAFFIEEWDEEHQQSRIRLAGEFHRQPDETNIQGRIVDELAVGETARVWKQCDQLNFFEQRPTICGYRLEDFEVEYSRHADLSTPVRDGEGNILVYGYSWLI